MSNLFNEVQRGEHLGAVEKAIESIRASLGSEEKIVASVLATRVERGNSGTERGALVVTNQRLIYSGGAWFGAGTNLEWRLQQLNGIAATKNLAFEHIEINAGGAVVKFLIQYGQSKPFVAQANRALADLNTSSAQGDSKSDGGDLGESLAKIADLFDRGLLSEDEFLSAKRRLLED